MADFTIRPIIETDRTWLVPFIIAHWGSDLMVVHGQHFYISRLPGFAAEADGQIAGLITYHISEDGCEVTSLDSLREGIGIGSALIEAVKGVAHTAGCKRLFLSTTNDNIHALYYYQRRGFTLASLRADVIKESRKIKPEIPLTGYFDIPLRDEIELEMRLV